MLLKRLIFVVRNVGFMQARQNHDNSPSKIRNIGILAHIDAGKTTTTERMLYYSGKTNSLGEVHHGNTITDYLTQERERGITICSSAVSLPWQDHRINILDTPGHIDFTMEVEQSLFAVDGTVIILDATSGVEAQTVTVWSQADRHDLPKIVFANKMDRPDANFAECLKQLVKKLDARPLPLQMPAYNRNAFAGLVDVIELRKYIWNPQSLGREYQEVFLDKEELSDCIKKRIEIIDCLSGIDDVLAERIITDNSINNVTNEMIYDAIRKATSTGVVIPVFLGAAYKNIGVQPLLNAILKFLPAPEERNQLYNCFGNDFAGKVFKVVHDKQRGPLSLVRVIRGTMKKGMRLVTMRGSSEVLQRIYEPLADEYKEITAVESGDVCVCAGLKNTNTGDLLVSSLTTLKTAQQKLQKAIEKELSHPNKEMSSTDKDNLDLITERLSLEPKIPEAVYFCSIEPPSISYQTALENALKQLQREDPSLRVKYDETTGQTVLGGMGELHLEIIKSRILSDYKVDADLGPLQIAYKETIDDKAEGEINIEKEIVGAKQQVSMRMTLVTNSKVPFKLDTSPESAAVLNLVRPRHIQLIKKGAIAALDRGPRINGNVVDTQILLHSVIIGRGTADPFIMAAAGQCVQKILRTNGTRLLEPMMSLQIIAPSEKVSIIIADLGRRRAIINEVATKGEHTKVIDILAPLAELTGYSSVLRTISSGTASLTMQPSGYSEMTPQDEVLAIRKAQGFA